MSNLRLTLRTLLAYLDDTLAPSEIKSIGDKVAESTTAQEIIARVKKLVRRRRLATPPFTGPGAKFDANTIAAYLDNTLDGDTVAALEEFCLGKEPSSELYLAEVAACHQILTLVLGEPMMVPATAKQRMYGLVQGREAIPYRKPRTPETPTEPALVPADSDLNEGSSLLGLSPRKSPWVAVLVPLVAILLLVGAALALFLALPQLTDEPARRTHAVVDPNKDAPKKDAAAKDAPVKDAAQKDAPVKDAAAVKDAPVKDAIVKDAPVKDLPVKDAPVKDAPVKDAPVKDAPVKDAPVKDAPVKDAPVKDGPMKDGGKEPMGKDPIPTPTPTVERPGAPSTARVELASYEVDRASPSILLQKQEKGWKRLPIGRVQSGETLVALPGSACEVKTDKGVTLLLRGFLPQFMSQDPNDPSRGVTSRLLESVVTLHQNDKVDADLTLHRGRLYIANGARPATVIVRFWNEAWVVSLTEPQSEIGLDLVTSYLSQSNPLDGEEPKAELYFLLLKGKAHLNVDTFEFRDLAAPPGVSFYAWTNKGPRMPGPLAMPVVPPSWSKEPPRTPPAQEMSTALVALAGATIPANQQPTTVFKQNLESTSPAARRLAVYALGAIDEVGVLIDVLGDGNPMHVVERDDATFVLRRWISRDAKHNAALFDEKTSTGVLIDKQFPRVEAEQLLEMLHALPRTPELKAKLVELLNAMNGSKRVAVRHVAHFLLERLTNRVANKPPYNAADADVLRDAAVRKLTEMLEKGELTPP